MEDEDEINYDEEDIDYNNYEDDYAENEIIEENKDQKQNNLIDTSQLNDYEIIQNSEIIKKRDVIINNFIECSNLNYDEAELVLVNYNWNYDKLIEEWFDNTEKIKILSHIEQSPESEKKISEFISNNNISSDICPVCYTEIEKDNSFSLKCNHQICEECYIEYIKNKLLTDPVTILQTLCPMNGCNLYITRNLYKKCIKEKKYQIIFAKSIIRNFLITNKEIKTCPNQKCNLSIRVQNSIPKEIKCKCGEIFCFSCLEESHIPCDCYLIKEWNEFGSKLGGDDYVWIKKENKNEIYKWTNSNIKLCPKCQLIIEKWMGCNHMTCKCGYQFCWNCLNSWSNHTKCKKIVKNKKEEPVHKIKEKKKNDYIPGKSKNNVIKKEKLTSFERYMKYYKEWFNYFKNSQFVDKIKERVSTFKYILIEDKNIIENDLDFFEDCIKTIIDCNRVLKYIFIFGYFVTEENIEELIENDLNMLQNQVDSLMELVELDRLPNMIKYCNENEFKKCFLEYKDQIISLINSTEKFKQNLVNELQNNPNYKIDYDKIKKLRNEYNIIKNKHNKK